MAFPRESSFMPTIKCSSCGIDIEISLMGEHICGTAGEPSPPPDSMGSYGSYNEPPPLENKYGRMAPPRVDTGAANRTYIRQDQLTPVSNSSGSRSVSPRTPNSRRDGGRSDEFFQPQIANDYSSTPPQQSRRPGGYGGFSDQDGYEADPMYPTSNPSKQQSGSLLQRMNTITPGPFEINRRAGAGGRNAFAPRNNVTSPEENMNAYSRNVFGAERPGTSASNNSFNSSGSNTGGIAPPRLPRANGYGGFGPPQQQQQEEFEPEPFGVNRSETFPRPNAPMDAPFRTPSEPGPRPDRLRRPSNGSSDNRRRPSMGRDTSRPPPPRTSLVRPTTSGRDAPPSINLADEFGVGNPYHTPSDSMSSSYSTFSSRPSQPSTQSSSQTSPARSRNGRNASDTSNFDNLMNDLQSSMADLKPMKDLPPSPQQPPPFDKTYNPYSNRQGPPPADLRFDPATQGRQGRTRSPLASPDQDRFNMPPPQMDRYDRVVRDGRRNEPSPPRSYSPMRDDRRRPPPAQSTRGSCKSCGLTITGKSISSADGRLTGRYHKACFVCTTCSEPFSSAEFYVLDDKPYCDIHYHKLNGSLCGTCGRGIEGQYLEDEESVKYHVGCFRCGDCGMSLSNGYFEVDGKSYCERDAWKRIQQQQAQQQQQSWMGPNPSIIEPEVERAPPGPAPGRIPMGLPTRPGARRPSGGAGVGQSGPRLAVGLPRGQRLPPGAGLGPMPKMNKRMTRLGMM